MKIRVYSPSFPFPATEGAHQVVADQVRTLSRTRHEVELVTWNPVKRGSINYSFRHTDLNRSRGNRDGKLARVARMLAGTYASPELFHYPVDLVDRWSELGAADVGIYHYSFSHVWLREKAKAPQESKVCVHFHNLEHELFEERMRLARNPVAAAIHGKNAGLLKAHEGELAELVDELWFLSPADQARYESGGLASRRLVPPSFEPMPRTQSAGKGSGNIGFIGALDFAPNVTSARWILDFLCPVLRDRGFTGRLKIAGKNASKALRASFREYPFVDLLGFVDDINSFWTDLSFSLVPHISGSGVRMKLLESIARGVPVLANSAAVSRIQPELRGSSLLHVSDDPVEWTRCILEGPSASTSAFPEALRGESIYSFLGGRELNSPDPKDKNR